MKSRRSHRRCGSVGLSSADLSSALAEDGAPEKSTRRRGHKRSATCTLGTLGTTGKVKTRKETWLESFLPATLDIQHAVVESPTGTWEPHAQHQQGCCMFIDISRFSSVTDKICSGDRRGAERIAGFLNTCFSQVVRLIQKSGGDIVKFAGDALIATWPVDGIVDSVPSVSVAVQRALQCAIDIRDTLPVVQIADDLSWSFKIGVGCGTVTILHLGGSQEYLRREYIIVGSALNDAFEAEKRAEPKSEVICTDEVLKEAGAYFDAEVVTTTSETKRDQGTFWRITRQKCFIKKKNRIMMNFVSEWFDTAERKTRSNLYLSESIMSYTSDQLFDSSDHARDWLSETRHVTVLFVHLGFSLEDFETSPELEDNIQQLNRAVLYLQAAMYDYEGCINKLNVDEKGITSIGIFGLSPNAHSNDATRGVLASLRFVSMVESQLGLNPSIGITTDICFCGIVGHSGGRKEFTVIGDAVNLSARLMQSAKESKHTRVLVDERTRNLVRNEVEFSTKERQIKVKGKMELIKVFSPSTKGRATVLSRFSATTRNSFLLDPSETCSSPRTFSSTRVDWQKEWQQQVARYGTRVVDNFRTFRLRLIHAGNVEPDAPHCMAMRIPDRNSSKCVTLIQAHVGSGKTHLLGLIWRQQAMRKEAVLLCATGNPFEKGALARRFSVWVDLVEQELGRFPPVKRQEILLRWLRMSGCQDTSAVYLLNELFSDVDFHSPEHHMPQDPANDYMIAGLIVSLLEGIVVSRSKSSKNPYVVCLIDDCMYMDEGSWSVIEYVVENNPRSISIVMTVDTLSGVCTPQLELPRKMIDAMGAKINRETIRPLSFGQLSTLIRLTLDVLTIPNELVNLVALTSLGNPLFAQEILGEMILNGLISVDEETKVCLWHSPFRTISDYLQTVVHDACMLLPSSKQDATAFSPSSSTSSASSFTSSTTCTSSSSSSSSPSSMASTFASASPCSSSSASTFMSLASPTLSVSSPTLASPSFGSTKGSSFVTESSLLQGSKLESHVKTRARELKVLRFLMNEATVKRLEKLLAEKFERYLEHEQVFGDGSMQEFKSSCVMAALQLDPPLSLCCVFGSMLDSLSARQQLILKVASFAVTIQGGIGIPVFHKSMVLGAVLLLEASSSLEQLQADFEKLEAAGVIRKDTSDIDAGVFTNLFTFVSLLLPNVLRLRTLEPQQVEIAKRLVESKDTFEEQIRKKFLRKARGKLAPSMAIKFGPVYVHKNVQIFAGNSDDHSQSKKRLLFGSAWKKRYAWLYVDRLEFSHDEGGLKRTGVCYFHRAMVSILDCMLDQRTHVLKLDVFRWEKHKTPGESFKQPRAFYISPAEQSLEELEDWQYKLKFAIESVNSPPSPRFTTSSSCPTIQYDQVVPLVLDDMLPLPPPPPLPALSSSLSSNPLVHESRPPTVPQRPRRVPV